MGIWGIYIYMLALGGMGKIYEKIEGKKEIEVVDKIKEEKNNHLKTI